MGLKDLQILRPRRRYYLGDLNLPRSYRAATISLKEIQRVPSQFPVDISARRNASLVPLAERALDLSLKF